MDLLNKVTGGSSEGDKGNKDQKSSGGGGGFLDKLNAKAGGGRESEKDEDMLDKGVDLVQEKVLGQGPQDNESAVEQAKDEQISDFIRDKYKSTTGSDIVSYIPSPKTPIADKVWGKPIEDKKKSYEK